jgi:hypothetical protein
MTTHNGVLNASTHFFNCYASQVANAVIKGHQMSKAHRLDWIA